MLIVIIFWIYCCFEDLHMIHCNLDLFYDMYSAIYQQYQEKVRLPSLILLSLFNIFVKEIQNCSSMISSVSLPIMISILLLFVSIVCVSLESLEEK